jgi:GT2 family glycosyltransferase
MDSTKLSTGLFQGQLMKKIANVFYLISALFFVYNSFSAPYRLAVILPFTKQNEVLEKSIEDLCKQTIFGEIQVLLLNKARTHCSPFLTMTLSCHANISLINCADTHDDLMSALEYVQAPYLTIVQSGSSHLGNAFEQRLKIVQEEPEVDVLYGDFWWSTYPNKICDPSMLAKHTNAPQFNPQCFAPGIPGPEPIVRVLTIEKLQGREQLQKGWTGNFWKQLAHKGVNFKKHTNVDFIYFVDIEPLQAPSYTKELEQRQLHDVEIQKKYSNLPLNAYPEKSFVIIVPSYNNSFWFNRNLNSIFLQNYSNYRVIYIDDCSIDGTSSLVQKYFDIHFLSDKTQLIANQVRYGCPLANIWNALAHCHDNEIAVLVDGDDWLAHENVLAHLNKIYQDQNIWMTYGQFSIFPFDIAGWAQQIPENITHSNAFRDYEWCSTHLRTFRVKLARHLVVEELSMDNQFYLMAGDLALMFPLLELAGFHAQFVPDILYIYNRANSLNEDKVNKSLQKACEKHIRARKKMHAIDQL